MGNLGTALNDLAESLPKPPWGNLPPRMRVLYITTYQRTGGWLAEAFAADSASDVVLEEAVGAAAGMERLRDEIFDAVLIDHEPEQLDALELLAGVRTGSSDEPIIVLGTKSESEMNALFYEVGGSKLLTAYLCINSTTTRTLIWTVARSIEHHNLTRENRRLLQADRQRRAQEHQEAERLLQQQWNLTRDLHVISPSGDSQAASLNDTVNDTVQNHQTPNDHLVSTNAGSQSQRVELPEEFVSHYRELLRAYIIMGSGNLANEMSMLAKLLVVAGISARQAMSMHLQVLEELVHGLGSRSARHVMTRADLLILEVMVHLAGSYHRQYLKQAHPPRQLYLPGF